MTTKMAQLGEKMKSKKHAYLVNWVWYDKFYNNPESGTFVFFSKKDAFDFVKKRENIFKHLVQNGYCKEGENQTVQVQKVSEDQIYDFIYSKTYTYEECFEQFMNMI